MKRPPDGATMRNNIVVALLANENAGILDFSTSDSCAWSTWKSQNQNRAHKKALTVLIQVESVNKARNSPIFAQGRTSFS